MENNIKLICLDLDGTTLKDISNISEKNIDYIRQAYKKGIKIALTTGRLFVHGMYFSKILNIPTYIISNNGTYVYDVDKNLIIYSSFFGVDNLVKIHKFVKEKYFNVHYSTIDTIYSNNVLKDYDDEDKKGEYAMKEVVIESEESWEDLFKNYGSNICKVVVSSDEIEKLENMLIKVREIGDFEVEYSWVNTVEILKKGEGKGTGIRNLKKYLNLKTENVMCIGDSENDVSMFKECGYKVAMKNGIDKLKDMADFITLDVSEDGVAYAIKKLLESC